jgi:NhaC family Na+:H+ antiporter
LVRPASGTIETAEYTLMLETLTASFNLTPWLLIAPAAVLFLVYKKTPALPALALGVVVGAVLLLVFQREPGAGWGPVWRRWTSSLPGVDSPT